MATVKNPTLGPFYLTSGVLDVTHAGSIYGLDGASSTEGGSPGSYFYAQAGDLGVNASNNTQIHNAGDISGGSGGNSYYPNNSAYPHFANAAAGGAGIQFDASGQLINTGVVTGGDGGNSTHGSGGAGGAGVVFEGSGSIQDSGIIAGGDGGFGVTAGAGGDGVALENGGTVDETGIGRIVGGNGGVGGIGVDLAHGGTLDVGKNATIIGGASSATGDSGGVGVDLNGGSLTNDGTIEGGAGGAGGSQGDSVLFGAASASMIVGLGARFDGAIGGFHHGDTIDLLNDPLKNITHHYDSATHTLNVYTGVDGTLQFAGDPHLIFSSNGSGGTEITCACFRRGTQILTERGERPVESLEIGDRVMTLSGELKPIRWIGQRHYSGQALLERPDVMPVLIRAGALGDHLPKRDMWVSPEHALYLGGALIPAGLLTNGVSILTDDSVTSVSYYHLEFESHEVVFAEGTPAESFVDDDSRQMFDNAADYAFRYPDAPRQSAVFCAPRVEDGEELEALRVKLAELASIPASQVPDVMNESSRISS